MVSLLGVVCFMLAFIGLAFQLGGNHLSALAAPPEYFPGAEPGAILGGILLDDEMKRLEHEVMLRGRYGALAQRLFNWSSSTLFASTVAGLTLTFPQYQPFCWAVVGLVITLLAVEGTKAHHEWRKSEAHERAIVSYNKLAPRVEEHDETTH